MRKIFVAILCRACGSQNSFSLALLDSFSRGGIRARSGNGTSNAPFPSSQVVKATPWLCQEITCSPSKREPRGLPFSLASRVAARRVMRGSPYVIPTPFTPASPFPTNLFASQKSLREPSMGRCPEGAEGVRKLKRQLNFHKNDEHPISRDGRGGGHPRALLQL